MLHPRLLTRSSSSSHARSHFTNTRGRSLWRFSSPSFSHLCLPTRLTRCKAATSPLSAHSMSNTPACRFGWDCQRPDCWFSHPSGRAIDGGGGASAVPSFPGALPSSAAGLPPHLQSSVLSPMSFNPSLLALHMQSLGLNPSNHSTSSPYPPVASSSVTKPITSSNLASSHDSYPPSSSLSSAAVTGKRGPQPCRYGRECHREECWFLHPEGRAIDEPGGGGGGGGGGGAGGPGGGVGGGGGRARRSSPGADEYDDALDEFEGKDGLTAEEEEEAAYRQAVSERGRGGRGRRLRLSLLPRTARRLH